MGNCLITQRQIAVVVCDTHAGVQMNLGETGQYALADKFLRVFYRCGLRQVLPRLRTEMVAAENNVGLVISDFISYSVDVITEVGRLHADVSAELIDLVACGFDQHFVIKTL